MTRTIIVINTLLGLMVLAGMFRVRLQYADDRVCVWKEQLVFSFLVLRESSFLGFLFRVSCFMAVGSGLACSPSFRPRYFFEIMFFCLSTG